jgi:hypothetical protein
MAFEYSNFISYRHEEQRNKFVKDFCYLFNTTTFDVTNLQEHFLDSNEIKGSPNFGEKIYEAIRKSYFFTIFHTYHYLNEANPWCAKELKYALDVEECRRQKLEEKDRSYFFSLNLFILSGTDKDLPGNISDRNALPISCYQHSIKKQSKAVTEFFSRLYDFMIDVYKIYQRYPHVDFVACCDEIDKPDDERIKEWIREQKKIILENEAKQLPVLKKYG